MISDAEMSGRPGRSASRTVRPFARSVGRDRGNAYGRGRAGNGSLGHDRTVAGRVVDGAHADGLRPDGRGVGLGGLVLGQIGQDESVLRPEDRGGDRADVLGRHRQVARQHPIDQARVVEQRGVHRQSVGPFLDPLERAEFVGLDQGPGAGQFVVGDELGRESAQLLVERRLDPRRIHARPDRRPARADRRAADEPQREDRDVLGDPLIADEAAVEPAALAARQDLTGDVERVQARVAEGRRPEPDEDPRQRDPVVDRLAHLAAEAQRQRQVAERRDGRVGRDPAEVALRRQSGRPPVSTSPTIDRTALFGA